MHDDRPPHDEPNKPTFNPRTVGAVDLRNKSLQRRQRLVSTTDNTSEPPAISEKKKRREMPALWYRMGFYGKFFSSLALITILAGASAAVYFNFIYKSRDATHTSKSVSPPKPVTIASPLTGLQVAPELAQRPVTAIMIENSLDARPQSGIQEAGVVFEAIAEGGITRFISLYQEAQPTYIGPVRSLRPYYIDWAVPFDASIAHIGGSPDALAQIRNGGKDLDQFFNSGSYSRISSRA